MKNLGKNNGATDKAKSPMKRKDNETSLELALDKPISPLYQVDFSSPVGLKMRTMTTTAYGNTMEN